MSDDRRSEDGTCTHGVSGLIDDHVKELCWWSDKEERWLEISLSAYYIVRSSREGNYYTRIWPTKDGNYALHVRDNFYICQSVEACKAAHALMGYP